MDNADDLQRARERVLTDINACWTTQAIAAAIDLGLPERVEAMPRTAADLAADCGCDPHALRRLLRALAALGLVTESQAGRFGLAPDGRLLLADRADSLAGYARMRAAQWEAWGGLLDSVRTGRSLRQRRGEGSDFAHLAADPARAAVFHRAMTELTRRVAPGLVAALTLDGDERVLDVGGGAGELLAALAEAHPRLRGDVLDLPNAAAAAAARLACGSVAGRCGFVAGDFFEWVPSGYHVYLMKSVLHDWDDDRAAAILRRVRPALVAPGARLAVVERVAPECMEPSARHRELVASDLNMLVMLSGHERSGAEFEALGAGAGLVLRRRVELVGAYELLEFSADAAP